MALVLSEDQEKACDKLSQFLLEKNSSKQFLLEGHAGTGKTTILQYLLNNPRFSNIDVCFSATTNKAVSVMKQMKSRFTLETIEGSRHFKTIHKLLTLKRNIDYEGNINWVLSDSIKNMRTSDKRIRIKTEKYKRITDYDVIIIDEVSMINKDMYDKIQALINNERFITKIIYVGDRAQLPPVNEDTSPVFINLQDKNDYYLLTEVKRNHHQTIYDFQKEIRGLVSSQERLKITPFKKRQDEQFTIIKKDEKALLDSYFKNLEENKPSIVLAYSNSCVNRYNTVIRNKLREIKNIAHIKSPYIEGEVILFNNYYKGNKISFYTSEQAKVKRVIQLTYQIEPFDRFITEQFSDHIKVFKENTENPNILNMLKDEKKDDTCPICLDKKIIFKKTICGHLFCKDCIREWLEINKCCPLCRMELKDNRIYISKSDSFNSMLDEFYDFTNNLSIEVYQLDVIPDVNIDAKTKEEYDIQDTILVCRDKKKYNEILDIASAHIKRIGDVVFKKLKGNKSVQKLFLSFLWTYYYQNFIDVFADITYGYCITTHKSQGSTYENCYVIMSNILMACPQYKDATRSLYTSVTRPSESLTLYY